MFLLQLITSILPSSLFFSFPNKWMYGSNRGTVYAILSFLCNMLQYVVKCTMSWFTRSIRKVFVLKILLCGFFWLSSAKQNNLVWIERQRGSWSCKSRSTNFIKSTTPLVVTPSSPPSIQIWTWPMLRNASRPIKNLVKSPNLAHSWIQTCICGRSLSTLPTKIFWNHRSFCWMSPITSRHSWHLSVT